MSTCLLPVLAVALRVSLAQPPGPAVQPGGAGSAEPPAAAEPSASPTTVGEAETPREILVELIVEDAQGRRIADLKPGEVGVVQSGAAQTIRSLTYDRQAELYELRFMPSSGRLDPVEIRLRRPGTRPLGPDGPFVVARWVEVPQPFEAPLIAALDAQPEPTAVPLELGVLRFQREERGLHHTLAAAIPLKALTARLDGTEPQAHVAFLARVRRANGRTVCQGGRERRFPTREGGQVVWTTQCHLWPGEYTVAAAIHDQLGGRIGVRKHTFTVGPLDTGLRMSDIIVLLGSGSLLLGEAEDNPLRVRDRTMVPFLKPEYVVGSEGDLPLIFSVYPPKGSTEPVSAAVELHREGKPVAGARLDLPAPDASGEIRHGVSIPLKDQPLGVADLRLIVRQGDATAERTASFEIIPPPHFGAAAEVVPVRVGGVIKEPKKLKHVAPRYPLSARDNRIEGTVLLECVIDPAGNVTKIMPISGHPLLMDAAVEAVRQWKYTPTVVDGKPVPVIMKVNINFRVS